MGVKIFISTPQRTVARSGQPWLLYEGGSKFCQALPHIGARVADSKDKQKGAIASFVLGSDVLVILPTGYGQSLCFTCYHCCCYSATDV